MWKEKSLYRCITKNCQSMSHLGRKNDLVILAFCQSRTKRLDMDKLLHRFASDKRRLRLVVQIRSNCLSLCVSTLYAGIVTFLFTLIINACLHSWFVSNDSWSFLDRFLWCHLKRIVWVLSIFLGSIDARTRHRYRLYGPGPRMGPVDNFSLVTGPPPNL